MSQEKAIFDQAMALSKRLQPILTDICLVEGIPPSAALIPCLMMSASLLASIGLGASDDQWKAMVQDAQTSTQGATNAWREMVNQTLAGKAH